MLHHLAGPGAAAHADVLEGTPKTGGLVALKVGQADEHIGVHDGAADLGGLAVLAVGHRHFHLIRAAQAVADQDLAAGVVMGQKPLVWAQVRCSSAFLRLPG